MDLSKQQVMGVRRDTGAKAAIPLSNIVSGVQTTLETMQSDMFSKAKTEYDAHIKVLTDWKDFVPALNAKNVCAVPWCEVEACEDDIKDTSAQESAQIQDDRAPSAGAKSLCIPFDQDRWGSPVAGKKCIKCGKEAKKWTLFGRSCQFDMSYLCRMNAEDRDCRRLDDQIVDCRRAYETPHFARSNIKAGIAEVYHYFSELRVFPRTCHVHFAP